MMPLSYCKTYCESRPVFLGSVPRASSIRGLSRGVVSGQRIAQHDWTRPLNYRWSGMQLSQTPQAETASPP
jgi:hypothetical protein